MLESIWQVLVQKIYRLLFPGKEEAGEGGKQAHCYADTKIKATLTLFRTEQQAGLLQPVSLAFAAICWLLWEMRYDSPRPLELWIHLEMGWCPVL